MRPARKFASFKGRTHAPSKPVARGGKKVPMRPEKRTGYFGFVTPRMEAMALKAERHALAQRARASLVLEAAARAA